MNDILADALIKSFEAHWCLDCSKIVSISSYAEHSADHTLWAVTVINGHLRNRLREIIKAAEAFQK